MEELKGNGKALIITNDYEEPIYMTSVEKNERVLVQWKDSIDSLLVRYEKEKQDELFNQIEVKRSDFRKFRKFNADADSDSFWNAIQQPPSNFNSDLANEIRDMFMHPFEPNQIEYQEEVDILIALENNDSHLIKSFEFLKEILTQEKEDYMKYNNVSAPRLSNELYNVQVPKVDN
tara:strand:+ start:78 stop:605 length:528 start_codon:yes stop_codon:yes gene_type:complete